ncbi:RNA pyrophosphohydrolase [Litoreibacter roseus]|uniref:RNA pyrophosphohydrolase n=2 Tax=Litoreibacter roseus TaxID=2601869 RepID=A0A6N6JH99_9RHOB|nr:RNA pyrophosphohydrolase [Litoreibacter roseus]
MLANKDGKIFVGERLDTPEAWQMPQGGIDEGETPETAAFRELEEEIGVSAHDVIVVGQTSDWVNYDFPPEIVAKVANGRFRGQTQMWFLMRLSANDDAINIETKYPEFGRWRWADINTIVGEIVPFKRPVYEKVVAEFRDMI